jgi:hypothetical protein
MTIEFVLYIAAKNPVFILAAGAPIVDLTCKLSAALRHQQSNNVVTARFRNASSANLKRH